MRDPALPESAVDVAVVGDGPAGAALAAACCAEGLSVVLVGPGAPWTNTYGSWVDEIADLPGVEPLGDRLFVSVCERVVAFGERRHELGRAYGVIDAAVLRDHLLARVPHRESHATGVQHFEWGSRVLTSCDPVDARHVVDATGAGGTLLRRRAGDEGRPVAWQTAHGVVLDQLPDDAAIERDAVTLMDFREPPRHGPADDVDEPTFCYVVPVAGGWLVEETVLAARRPVDPDRLRPRLARRLGRHGADLVASSTVTEQVRIPMGGPVPDRRQPVIGFGAAASYIHPATGFSVASSLRAAPQVARAIARGDDPWSAVWPAPARRARRLHTYGAEALLGFGPHEVRAFFDAFFDLPADRWGRYLRVDASPGEVAGVMSAVFSSAPWPVRRRLMAVDPRTWFRMSRR